MEMENHQRWLVVFCTAHVYGKLILIDDIDDDLDTEGNLQTVTGCLQICRRGFFKWKPCVCELHGVIDIDENNIITLDRKYGYPHERKYPKGWELKYYLRDVGRNHVLQEYFKSTFQ